MSTGAVTLPVWAVRMAAVIRRKQQEAIQHGIPVGGQNLLRAAGWSHEQVYGLLTDWPAAHPEDRGFLAGLAAQMPGTAGDVRAWLRILFATEPGPGGMRPSPALACRWWDRRQTWAEVITRVVHDYTAAAGGNTALGALGCAAGLSEAELVARVAHGPVDEQALTVLAALRR